MESTKENSLNISQKRFFLNKNLLIVFGITLISILGVSSISPAFPKIIQEVGISNQAVGLLFTVFTIPSVILTPVLGIFADRFGRKKILIPSLMLFGIAGFLCSFSSNFTHLLIWRFFQGIGSGSLGTLNLTIIGDLYSGPDLTKAMGYNGAVTSIGTAIFPIIGGALAMYGWYYPFMLPIIAIPMGILVLFLLENPEPKQNYELIKYVSNALKNMRNRNVLVLFIASIITFILLYGSLLTYFPILIDYLFNISPIIINVSTFIIGLIISSYSIAAIISSGLLGKITEFYSRKILIKMAFMLYGSALLLIPIISELWMYLIPFILFGIAQGINVPSIQALFADLSPMEQRGIFMSINGMFLFLGQTLGPLLTGLLFGLWGIAAPFVIGGIFSLGFFLLLIIILK